MPSLKQANAVDLSAKSAVVAERTQSFPNAESAHPQLFRTEALTYRQTQWLGTVLLTPRRSHRIFTIVAVFAIVAIASLLIFGEFTRKARVEGWLMPQQGLVRVFAPQPGVVSGLYVHEGTQVRKGERLLRLSGELESVRLGATEAEIIRRLSGLRDALKEERRQQQRLLVQRQRSYSDRVAMLRSESMEIDRQIETMRERVRLAERNVMLNRKLRADGYISEPQFQIVQGEHLERQSQLGALRRQRIELRREQVMLEGELKDLPVKVGADIASIERNIVAAEQELAQAEARREIFITAPQDGTVSAVLVDQGGYANVSGPLLSIVPTGAALEAHLYGPSRAVGFVHPGQKVLLRYQAYPYQKFGHHEGVAVSVSRSAVSPSELPPQLAGILGTTPGVLGTTPVYRITVRLKSQTVKAYGQAVPLQPGMQLEADIALDRRRLYEWMLDPLYTVTGRQQR
ncbi:hypothetical protein GCM10011487_15860 [Steroidobacter agaridevorans]|uniref:AprE-like beta-barrel domain-containing protein n=1 Tax=Steroidobacter agaridevorans TaxID=2695856 RepID=A0A829YA38_9GAMM|nr:HlyD family efflux transporter periplasmic adaptor subunit [Steroidobacter agaridevorans]GFE79586.1 hypothetical protein GCM10011487_15860 [Steroidobacter agaridevorans]